MVKASVEPGIDVLGVCLHNVYDGFGAFKSSASRIMKKFGLGQDAKTGLITFDPDAWYPLHAFLDALGAIAEEAGEGVVLRAGMAVPNNVVWPPHVKDVYTAIESIDIAYHMNHGKHGAPLFDPATGTMQEGIGHYKVERMGEFIQVVCENPYPCEFDRGLITSIATQFKPRARVQAADGSQCRKHGDSLCTYNIVW